MKMKNNLSRCSMSKLLIVIIHLLFISISEAQESEGTKIPTLNIIPAELLGATFQTYNDKSQKLALERGAVIEESKAFTLRCKGVKDQSAEDQQCKTDYALLFSKRKDISERINTFNKDLIAQIQKSVDDNYWGVEGHKLLKPQYITKAQDSTAKKELERLIALKKKFENKIIELEKWKNDQKSYSREIDDIRAAAIKGSISDILDAVPIENIVETMALMENYKKYSKLLKAGYDAVKATNEAHTAMESAADALFAKDDMEATRKMIAADYNAEKVLLTLSSLPESDKKWLKAVAKLYQDRAKIMFWNVEQKEKPAVNANFFVEYGEEIKEGLDIVGVFYPPARIGVAIERLSERYVALTYTPAAVEALNNSLNQNIKADFLLRQRIESINSSILEQNRLIAMHEQQK